MHKKLNKQSANVNEKIIYGNNRGIQGELIHNFLFKKREKIY